MGHFVGAETPQDDDLLKVIQFVPFSRKVLAKRDTILQCDVPCIILKKGEGGHLPVRLRAVKDEFKPRQVVLEVFGELGEAIESSQSEDFVPGSSRDPIRRRICDFFGFVRTSS